MGKKTFSKFLCSCIAFVFFVICALSCASTESTPVVKDVYNKADRDGAQAETKSSDDITSDVNFNYELN